MRGFLARHTPILWYAGKLGLTVRVGDLRFTMQDWLRAGTLRIGGYERAERTATRFLPPNQPLIELGAAVGVVACVANRRLHNPRSHRCVEPNPAALPLLRQNRDQNGCGFEIIHAAVAYNCTQIQVAEDLAMTFPRIYGDDAPQGAVTVRALSLRDIAEGFDTFSLICDIEGAEIDMLRHDVELIASSVGTFIVERHPQVVGADADTGFHDTLIQRGFRVRWQRGNVWVYERDHQALGIHSS